ncbi:MAG: glycosyltransferase [Bradymonadia bacterium]
MWWVSVISLGVLLLFWTLALLKMLKGDPKPPEYVLDDETTPDPLPDTLSLSVVIPARNEAHNIEACVRSVLSTRWSGPLQVVVIDDRSTDGTGEILARIAAEDDRLLVVEGADPPSGWLGKPHALHLAQKAATGDWLMFIDADVVLDPLGPQRIIGRAASQEIGMCSGLGRLVVESFWEKVMMTRMGGVIAGGNPLEEVNDPEHERALANGQCLIFSRATYDAMGGHEAIKGSVLDDVDFARKAKAEKVPYRLYFAPGVFRCRMYTGFKEIWEGWTKNLFPALEYSYWVTFIVTVLLFASTVLPFVLLAKNLVWMAAGYPVDPTILGLEIGICAVALAMDFQGHRTHGYAAGTFWTFPLGMFLIVVLFWRSAWRIGSGKGAVWKGRVVEAGGRPQKPSGD